MDRIDWNKVLRMFGILVLILVIVGVASFFRRKNSVTLEDYAKAHPAPSPAAESPTPKTPAEESPASEIPAAESAAPTDSPAQLEGSAAPETEDELPTVSTLTGALLNGGADGKTMLDQRVTYQPADAENVVEAFYYEPLSENLQRYITGISYPAANTGTDALAVTYDDLRYLHVLHYDFDGNPTEGELICNAAIAQDLLDIFYELYRNEYQIEKMLLIDAYDGDDTASMEDNNTSCFNYRLVENSTSLSKHALGLAIDINPFYNPYITYNKDGSRNVSPAAAEIYADRNTDFAYKIDETDLCYKLFVSHGFIWGGNWNSVKDYQHFQKVPK